MNERDLRPGSVAAAAVLIGGALVVVLPQYAWSILQLVIVTVPVAIGLHVLAARVPPTGWLSPFKWMSPFAPSRRRGRLRLRARDELDLIRARLSGWRQPVAGAPALPPGTLTLLKPLIGRALELDPHDMPPGEAARTEPPRVPRPATEVRPEDVARTRVSPLTWAVLTTEPRKGLRWIVRIPPDRREVARTVEHVLDDLDRLNAHASHPRTPGAP